jgi:hypothetical protein
VIKVGRLVRVAPEALDEWIHENTYHDPPCARIPPARAPKQPKTGRFDGLLEELRSDEAKGGRK